MKDLFEAALQRDESVVLLGAGLGRADWSRPLFETFGPRRVIEVPVADRAALGLATGLALQGAHAVLILDGADRIAAVLEGLAACAAIHRAGAYAVGLTVLVPFGDEAGPLDLPVGWWAHRIPGLSVVCGSSGPRLGGLLLGLLGRRSPALLLAPRALLGRQMAGPPVSSSRLDCVDELRPGHQVTLAGWGPGVGAASLAADMLASEGISAGVVDLVALAPLDRRGLGAIVRRTGRLVVVHPGDPSLAADVAGVGLDEAFLYLEAPLVRVGPSPEAVASAARDAVHY